MANDFEQTLRDQVEEIASRLGITKSKAFAVWYGKVVLRLQEQEALEAASYDGGNDRGTDFFFVDDEWDRVIVAQWKYYASSKKAPKAGDLTQLFHIPSELSDPQDLRDDGREDLAEAADALNEARDRGYALDLRFVYPGQKDKDRDREPQRLVRTFNRDHRGEEITASLVRLDDLAVAYEDFKGSADRVHQGRLDFEAGEFLQEDHTESHSSRPYPAHRSPRSTRSTVIACSIRTFGCSSGAAKGASTLASETRWEIPRSVATSGRTTTG